MNKQCNKEVQEINEKNCVDNILPIQLFSRLETSKILAISISQLDKISETMLKKIRIGRSVRYSYEAIIDFINLLSKEVKYEQ